MGSHNCTKNLYELGKHLTKFEQVPKEINGRRPNAWFQVGEDIFKELFETGRSVNWQYSELRRFDLSDICSQIERNADWIESFISLYPIYLIDFDLVGSSDDICQVRSGIDVLFKGFTGYKTNFDKVLQDITKTEGIDELDRCLKLWIETGHRPDFIAKSSNLSPEHWWWF